MVINMINNKFNIEEMPDLTTNPKYNPFASLFRNELLKYTSNNIVLENGQMIYINLSQEQLDKIFEYNMEIFTNLLRSENKIVECENLIKEYCLNGKNNTSTYVNNCYDIIINMDKVNKYIWNICKMLNDNVESYSSYIVWQKDKIIVDKRIYEDWDRIYQIRNCIEHPKKLLSPTFMKRNNTNINKPSIIWEKKSYDLLELAKQSVEISYTFARLIIGTSFLYSKYTKVVTDEERKILYSTNN